MVMPLSGRYTGIVLIFTKLSTPVPLIILPPLVDGWLACDAITDVGSINLFTTHAPSLGLVVKVLPI